jgi:hypothetical protein
MEPFIYLRGLRHVAHTVFSVNDGQKYYTDPMTGRRMAYSSGQQVKRSILECLNQPFAAITFNWEIDKKGNAEMLEPHSPCDPSFADQLIGGYMKAEKERMTVKRRSPLSVSAMRPLHPLLGGLEMESEGEAVAFDRSSTAAHHYVNVYVTDEKGKRQKIADEQLAAWLKENKRSLGAKYYNPGKQSRATGLFVYDIAIDLRTLFCVSTNRLEPELYPETEEKLRSVGWIEGKNIFGPCLICPRERREQIIPALAKALINWRITSNQARTFSLMELLAVAVSDNAHQIAYAIRGELREDTDKPRALVKIDEQIKGEVFITPLAGGYVAGASGAADALDRAEQSLIDKFRAFDYENQL